MDERDHGLIGRTREYDVAVDAVRNGPGLVVVGEAGAGKTALVTAAVHDLPVRAGQCFRSLAWTPGVPLQQAIERPVPPGDVTWAAQAITSACAGALLRLDDLQWADPLTLEVLALLPPTLRLAVTVRSGDPGSDRALAVLTQRALTVVELAPLAVEDATVLALRRTPQLRPAEARRLAERCGGNPLLIEELGADPEPHAGLRRSVMGRLRRLGEAAWQSFAMLAVADEPLVREWLPDAAALESAGLIVDIGDGRVQPRHPLLAEAMAQHLADGAVSRRHAAGLALADRAEREGRLPLAARCCAAADANARATDLALRAAAATDRQGERAALLYLAASSAAPQKATELTVQAVEELVVAGDYDQAARLIDAVEGVDDAHWWGLVGRVRWQQGDDDAAMGAYEHGLSVATPGTAEAVLLAAEQARAVALALGDYDRALVLARTAHEAAVTAAVEVPRSLAVLGTVEHFAGEREDCLAHLEQAVELARDHGDVMVEFTTANNLISSYESYGEIRQAIALARTMAARAATLHMRRWQRQMLAMAFNASMHLGEYDELLAEIPVLLTEAGDRRTRDQLELTLALAQADIGANDQAIERLDTAIPRSFDDYFGRGSLLYGRAEVHLWAGNPQASLADATDALELTSTGPRELFPLLTIAHSRLRLGEPVEAQEWPDDGSVPLTAGAVPELDGIVAVSAGDVGTAAALFADAAAKWAGEHRRAELRCRWLAAEYSPDEVQAREQLLALEQELSDLGWQPLLGQVRRSLRARGVRSAAPRGRVGGLTAREREVMDLVGQGLSTDAVASRLGLSPATVAAQISSARARLGATTRWQASSAG